MSIQTGPVFDLYYRSATKDSIMISQLVSLKLAGQLFILSYLSDLHIFT